MKLSEAIKQVGPEENIEAAFLRLYGQQVQPENFRKVFQTVRNCPAEILQAIQQHADKSPEEAFRAIHPDYVNIGEFMAAVLESRKPAAVVVQEPVVEDLEETEG